MSLKVSQLLFYSSTQHVVIFTLSYTSSEIYIYSVYNDNTLWNNILFCTLFCFIIFCKKKSMNLSFSRLYYKDKTLELLFLHQWRETRALKEEYIMRNRGVHVFYILFHFIGLQSFIFHSDLYFFSVTIKEIHNN